LGGRVAEEMIFGEENVTSGAHSDIVKATDVAKRMVRFYGMSEKVGPVGYDDEEMQLLSAQTKLLIEGEIKSLVIVSGCSIILYAMILFSLTQPVFRAPSLGHDIFLKPIWTNCTDWPRL
jgi:hypothetical protein